MPEAFTPHTAATVNLSVSASSSRVALGAGGTQIRLFNGGSSTLFFELGDSSVTAATTTGVPLPSGAIEVLSVSPSHSYIAAITASGTATLYATKGAGA